MRRKKKRNRTHEEAVCEWALKNNREVYESEVYEGWKVDIRHSGGGTDFYKVSYRGRNDAYISAWREIVIRDWDKNHPVRRVV